MHDIVKTNAAGQLEIAYIYIENKCMKKIMSEIDRRIESQSQIFDFTIQTPIIPLIISSNSLGQCCGEAEIANCTF